MNLREFSDFLDKYVEYLDEEREDLTVQQKHDMVFALCDCMASNVEKSEKYATTIRQLRRMMNNALMNFGGGVY